MSQNITAVQRVWGIAELGDLIYLNTDPMTLLSQLENISTAFAIYSSKALKHKLYLSQLPKIPVEIPNYDDSQEYNYFERRAWMYNKWTPNRILLPSDTSTFTFRVPSLLDLAITIRMAWQGGRIDDDKFHPEVMSGPNEELLYNEEARALGPFDICYPIIQCSVGPLHEIPDWARTMPERMVEGLKKPVTTDPPLSNGVLRTVLIDRATDTLVMFDNTNKDIHGRLKYGRMDMRIQAGTTLGDLVARIEDSRDNIRHYRTPGFVAREAEVQRMAEKGKRFRQLKAEYHRSMMSEEMRTEAEARGTNGVPSIFGQSPEFYEELYEKVEVERKA